MRGCLVRLISGCMLRLSLIFFALILMAVIRAIWYVCLAYLYSIVCLWVGLPKSVERITEAIIQKAYIEWSIDSHLEEFFRHIVPPLVYASIIACWFFTAFVTYGVVRVLLQK